LRRFSCFIHPELFDFGSVTGTGNVGGSSVSATTSASAAPLSVSASFSAQPNWAASVTATATYSFEWVGPSGTAGSIPTDIGLIVHTAVASGTYQSTLNFQVVTDVGQNLVYNNSWGCTFNSCSNPDFNGTLLLNLSPNVIYDLTLMANTHVLDPFPGAHFGGGSASAFGDPHVFLDPSFNNPLYSLALSDGVGNTTGATTPLPSTWTMLIAGFLGLGFLAYHGTKNRTAAIAAA
jgi:hypothetical protein